MRYGGIVAYDEDKFFKWVLKMKGSGYDIKQSSFFEKFDKSRRANRVDPTQKGGPIKFLKIEKTKLSKYPTHVIRHIEEIEKMFPEQTKLRFLTHRDWKELPVKLFSYKGMTSILFEEKDLQYR